jgi:hypothetical protein
MYRLGWLPIHDLLHFDRIHGYPFLGNSVTQKFHTIQPELTFGEFGRVCDLSNVARQYEDASHARLYSWNK